MGRGAFALVRFFTVVTPLPPMIVGTLVVAWIAAAAVAVLDVARVPAALLPILLLHLFAASSGFAGPARRGYYDILLTRGDPRLLIAVTHWLMSVSPGGAAWLGLACVEAARRGGFPEASLASGTLAAMALVSAVSWAITVNLPRFSGAIGWLALAAGVGSMWRPEDAWRPGTTPSTPGALAALIRPDIMIGRQLSPADLVAVAPAMLLAAALLAIACAWVARADYPLEAGQ